MPAPYARALEQNKSVYVAAASTSVGAMLGVFERGPINKPIKCSTWADVVTTFGEFIAGSNSPDVLKQALDLGCQVWVTRVVALDANSLPTALAATAMLQTPGGGISAGKVQGNVAAALWQGNYCWPLAAGDKLGWKDDAGVEMGPIVFAALPATKNTGAAPFAIQNNDYITLRTGPASNPGPVRKVTFTVAVGGAATAREVADALAAQLPDVEVVLNAGPGTVTINSDIAGTSGRIEFVGDGAAGATLTALGYVQGEVLHGTGNVGDIDHVSSGELQNLIAALDPNGVVFAIDANHYATLTRSVVGAAHSVQVYDGGADPAHIAGAAALGLDTNLHLGANNAPVDTLLLEASSAGAWGNSLLVDTANAKQDPVNRFRLVLWRNGIVLESHEELSMDPTDPRYVVAVLAAASNYLVAVDQDCGLAFAAARPAVAAQQALGVTQAGSDGSVIGDTDYIGDQAHKTGFHALDGVTGASFLAVPGNPARAVLVAGIAYCEARADMVFLMDAPMVLHPQDVADFRNAAVGSVYAGEAPLVSTYAAMYWPWVGVPDPLVKGATKFISPLGQIFGIFARTDRTEKVWFAPAGGQRGQLKNVDELSYQLAVNGDGTGDDGTLYDNGINPIINDPQFGFMANGQKTLAPAGSKVDRLNVRRELIYIRLSLLPAIRATAQFEPNDDQTWSKVKALADPWLKQVADGRGLRPRPDIGLPDGFLVICDGSNNTEQDIEAKNLNVEIALQPMDAAEFITVAIVNSPDSAVAAEQ